MRLLGASVVTGECQGMFVLMKKTEPRCECDVEVLHGYCPSQPDSIKCCPKQSTEEPDDACEDEDSGGEDCSEITCNKGVSNNPNLLCLYISIIRPVHLM